MRKLQLLLTAILLSGLTMSACTESGTQDEVNTEMAITFENITNNTLEVGYEEGVYTLPYTIVNGLAGIDIVAETRAEWISDVKVANGELSFKVARNNNPDVRTGRISVKYPTLSDISITVSQLQFDAITFEMSITDSTSTTCTTLITPSNEDYAYIAYMAEVDYFLSAQITTAEELFQDDYNYYMAFAQQWEAPLLKEFFLMNYIAYQGEYSIDWTGMMPGKEYVLYVYAIEFNEENSDYWLASPITYQLITLQSEGLTEVDFDVDVDINGPNATYSITPQNWEGYYYLTVYEEGDYMYRNTPADEDYSKLISSVWLDMMSQLMASGYAPDQIIGLMCLQGHEEYSELLKGDTNYALVIYAVDMVDGMPQVVSKPQVVNFTTEAIGASNMTLDIKVENKYVRVADITVTPSTNEYYTVAIVPFSEVPESSNAEIIAWLNDNFSMETYHGEIFSHLNTLQPETSYSILAYGYYGGVVTTDLFRYDFTTDAASECENSVVRVDFDGPYSLAELEAYDPDYYYNYGMFETMGWYAMWAEIIPEKPSQDLFYCIYSAQELSVYGEDAIFADLVSYPCQTTQLLTGENDKLYVMCAVVMDYKGNYSDMWVSEPFMYNYNSSTKRPVEELISKIHGN